MGFRLAQTPITVTLMWYLWLVTTSTTHTTEEPAMTSTNPTIMDFIKYGRVGTSTTAHLVWGNTARCSQRYVLGDQRFTRAQVEASPYLTLCQRCDAKAAKTQPVATTEEPTMTTQPKYVVNDRLAFRRKGNPETLPVIVTVFELRPVGDLMRYVVSGGYIPGRNPTHFHAFESELMPLDHMAVTRLEPGSYFINYGANNYNVWRAVSDYGDIQWITDMQNGLAPWATSDTLTYAKNNIRVNGK